jgi:cell division protease FtsH
VHATNKKLSDAVDLQRVAKTSAGFSAADLENLMNEAAINAARKNKPCISQEDIDEAFIKVGIGSEKRSKLISEKEKKITAYHEMGHAILFEALPNVGPVHTVSIIPTGLGAAGYTMPLPEKDEMFNTKGRMLEDIMVAMGGRIAEELAFDDITTGASQDIRQATDIARDMVMKYGMSEKIGFVNYEQQQDTVYEGRDIGHTKNYGSDVYNAIEEEVKRILGECYEKAKAIVLDKKDVLDKGAAFLIEHEKMTQEEFEAIYHGKNA